MPDVKVTLNKLNQAVVNATHPVNPEGSINGKSSLPAQIAPRQASIKEEPGSSQGANQPSGIPFSSPQRR